MPRPFLLFALALVLGGCAATPLPPLPETHPGNPDAPEAPGVSGAPSALRDDGLGETAPATSYTCPMHPEVHAAQPGQCPKCGMTLVPETTGKPMGGGGHAH
ncbi:MAG: heavy metal-binding domain-containing protein [Pirellulales bacterium]